MDILTRFAETLNSEDAETLQHVREYVDAQSNRGQDLALSDYDDVAIRTYLLSIKAAGISPSEQRQRIASLRRFTNGRSMKVY